MARMDKNERLLSLLALLVDARAPLSWSALRQSFPDEYGKGTHEAALRRFERDKADLAELGVALEYLPPDPDGEGGGYRLDPESWHVGELALTSEESAVLYSAASAALARGLFPGKEDLANALRKLSSSKGGTLPHLAERRGGAGGHREDAEGDEGTRLAEQLDLLWSALLARKRVTLRYHPIDRDEETLREVDPWGICLRRGNWLLVGYCHLRLARRTFYLHRIAGLSVNAQRPRTPDYELPSDFHIEEVAREQPWEHPLHAPVEVSLEFSEAAARQAATILGGDALQPLAGGGARASITARNLDALLRRALALGPEAQVIADDRARARHKALLEAIREAHR